MRTSVLMLALILAVGIRMCGHMPPGQTAISTLTSAPVTVRAKPDFKTQIRPILQSKCQPCHFQGGTVYERMPFDRPETITRLGTKLFTRIKDEDQRRLIREFLAQP